MQQFALFKLAQLETTVEVKPAQLLGRLVFNLHVGMSFLSQRV